MGRGHGQQDTVSVSVSGTRARNVSDRLMSEAAKISEVYAAEGALAVAVFGSAAGVKPIRQVTSTF